MMEEKSKSAAQRYREQVDRMRPLYENNKQRERDKLLRLGKTQTGKDRSKNPLTLRLHYFYVIQRNRAAVVRRAHIYGKHAEARIYAWREAEQQLLVPGDVVRVTLMRAFSKDFDEEFYEYILWRNEDGEIVRERIDSSITRSLNRKERLGREKRRAELTQTQEMQLQKKPRVVSAGQSQTGMKSD